MHPSMIARGAVARFGVKPYPLGLTYEVSWLCNLACKYCDRHTPLRNELGRDDIFRALSEFHELGMRDVNLDGPRENHDAMRGTGSFDHAIAGARAARSAGVAVEFTSVVENCSR